MMKLCCRCNQYKDELEFYKDKTRKSGIYSYCKLCTKERAKNWTIDNRERCNKRSVEYRKNNLERRSAYEKQWALNNKERIRYNHKKWRLSNPDKVKEMTKKTRYARLKTDVIFKLRSNVSINVCNALKRQRSSKSTSVWSKLSYAPERLKLHLELLWEPWMNWNNYGNKPGCWVIDHVIPQSKLPYTNLDDVNFLKCWGLSNLRPLEYIENIKKGNK